MILQHPTDLSFTLGDLESMPAPQRALMVRPTYFDIEYVINPHMEGNIGNVNKAKALEQWTALENAYREIGFDVPVLDGAVGYPDMVFCANQSFPFLDRNGMRHVMMSRMAHPQRRGEVGFLRDWYHAQGYQIHELAEAPESDQTSFFEGMGDALWHFGKRLIWGGYGYRTSLEIYEQISRLTGIDVIALELISPEFYHLDTCMSMLDEEHVLIYPGAFTEEGLALIEALFPHVIHATKDEAATLFAVNACCPDGKHVFIQAGCSDANRQLRDHGFEVREFDTSEYMRSGGSVFCMKMLLW